MIKKMWLFLLLLAVSLFSAEGDVKKEIVFEPGQTLEIDLKNGGKIEVTGWNEKKVEMAAKFVNGDRKSWDIRLDKTAEGAELVCKYLEESRNIRNPHFLLHVPVQCNLEIRTMGGSVVVTGIEGKISGRTMGGDLVFKGLNGALDFQTMGGDVKVFDSTVNGKVHTMGGHVLLENIVGDLDGSSMGGNVIQKNVKSSQWKGIEKAVKISTMGGAINVDEAISGADVHTMGGKIHIRKAAKFVKAETMGGDILIEEIDGSVKATTMGGEIEVTMTGDPATGDRSVELVSMAGDITLRVPANLSMTLDLEIKVHRHAKKEYRIESEFPVTIHEEKSEKNLKKDILKIICAEGKTGGGAHNVTIKTVNGNIRIIKNK